MKHQVDFLELLQIDYEKYPVIAVVGGGGKTSLIYRLTDELIDKGKRVIITTTTHMAGESELPFARGGDAVRVKELLDKERYVIAAEYEEDTGKYASLTDEKLEELRELCDVMLVEADGAKHHAAVVGRRRGDVPHARCYAARDRVLANDGNLETLEYVGRAGKADARFGLGHRRFTLPHVVQAVDIGVGILESHTVGKQTDVFLELLKGRFGVRAKVAIVLAAGKAQNVERLLQGLHVGAMEIGHTQVEGAVAQLIRGVDQGTPAGDVNGVAGGKTAVEPKGANGLLGGGTKALVGQPVIYILADIS